MCQYRHYQQEDAVLAQVVHCSIQHADEIFRITFAEGDVYEATVFDGNYFDNDKTMGTPDFEEWYEVDFEIASTIKPGPNANPDYDFITVSGKHMPTEIATSAGKVLYSKAATE